MSGAWTLVLLDDLLKAWLFFINHQSQKVKDIGRPRPCPYSKGSSTLGRMYSVMTNVSCFMMNYYHKYQNRISVFLPSVQALLSFFHLLFLCKNWFVLKFFFDMSSLLIPKPSFFPFSYTSFVCFLFFSLSSSSSFSSIFVFLCTHHSIN